MAFDPASNKTRYEERMERRRERHERMSLIGPVMLVTIGVLFLIAQYVPAWGFGKTWPVILIVLGVTKVLESAYSTRSMPPNH